jgi:hypothetical protein
MEVTIQGNAELIVKKLVGEGRFPSPDRLVAEAILRTFIDLSSTNHEHRLLPNPVIEEEPIVLPAFPHHESVPVVAKPMTTPRLPDRIFD